MILADLNVKLELRVGCCGMSVGSGFRELESSKSERVAS